MPGQCCHPLPRQQHLPRPPQARPVLCSRREQSVWRRRERTRISHHLQDQQMYGHHSHDHTSLCAWRGEQQSSYTKFVCVPQLQPMGKGSSSTATVSRVDIMRRLLTVNQHFIKCLDLFNTRKLTYVTRV